MRPWRVVPHTVAPAAAQLARSDALRREVAGGAPPAIRWYGYSAPAIILGIGQALHAVDGEAAAAAGTAVVKRLTGGAAVLADETLLALDVALPGDDPLGAADVLAAYRWLGAAICQALGARLAGVAGRVGLASLALARADQAAQRQAPAGSAGSLRGLACFGTLSPHEVVLHGSPPAAPEAAAAPAAARPARKLVGLSQVRKRGVVLYQAGLYTTGHGAALARLLQLPAPQRALIAAELPRRIAALDEVEGGGGATSAVATVMDTVTEAIVTASSA